MKTKRINMSPHRTYKRGVLREHFKFVDEEGDIIEKKIWEVERDADYPEGIKYSLVFIHKNRRLVGYDNHERKGHHKHIKGRVSKISFSSIDELKEQFKNDVVIVRKKLLGEENDKSETD